MVLQRLANQRHRRRLRQALPDYQLPSFPDVVARVRDLVRDPKASLAQLGDAIAQDPGLSTKVLSVVNSGAVYLRSPVDTVRQAVAMLGMSNVETLVVAVSAKSVLPSSSGSPIVASFWRSAARRAAVGQALAGALHPATRSESFTLGLLQDMAVPLLATRRPEVYQGVWEAWQREGGALEDHERAAMGFSHGEVAGWMCEAWQLPESFSDAIHAHHDDPTAESPCPPAVRIAAALEVDGPGWERARLTEELERAPDLAPENVSAVIEQMLPAAQSLEALFV